MRGAVERELAGAVAIIEFAIEERWVSAGQRDMAGERNQPIATCVPELQGSETWTLAMSITTRFIMTSAEECLPYLFQNQPILTTIDWIVSNFRQPCEIVRQGNGARKPVTKSKKTSGVFFTGLRAPFPAHRGA